MHIAIYHIFYLLLFIFPKMDKKNLYYLWNNCFFLIILTSVVTFMTVLENIQSLPHSCNKYKKQFNFLVHIIYWDTEIKMKYTCLLCICAVNVCKT